MLRALRARHIRMTWAGSPCRRNVILVAACVVSAATLAACGGSGSGPAKSLSTTARPSASAASPAVKDPGGTSRADPCVAVVNSQLVSLKAGAKVGAVKTDGQLGASGGDQVYYVAAPDGAVWITNIDPKIDTGGLVFPLNAKARSDSDMGVDVSPDAPIVKAFSATSGDARSATACSSK